MGSLHVLPIILILYVFNSYALDCKCPSQSQCKPVTSWNDNEREVIIMTNHSTSYKEWMWESITTVISYNMSTNHDLMCYTHAMGKKYGFYTDKIPNDYSVSQAMRNFILIVKEAIKTEGADVVAIDFDSYLSDCSIKKDQINSISFVMKTVIKEIKNDTNIKVLCVIPWKPPCYDNDCTLTASLADVCDAAILSFTSTCEESCTAKATASYNRVTLGMTEYTSFGFKQSQIILGIPWFGYNYTCQNYVSPDTSFPVCQLRVENGTCQLEASRTVVTVGSIDLDHPELIYSDKQYSRAEQAPWRVEVYRTGDNNQSYVTWFEDMDSLHVKYRAVVDYKLKGCAVFFGEDLTYGKLTTEFNQHMWSWLIHTTLVTGTPITERKAYNMAATVAGVGVGMFLFGTMLGLMIACIIFRRKKKLLPPFTHDPMNDEYRDDNEL